MKKIPSIFICDLYAPNRLHIKIDWEERIDFAKSIDIPFTYLSRKKTFKIFSLYPFVYFNLCENG